jgi:hypothetical protein
MALSPPRQTCTELALGRLRQYLAERFLNRPKVNFRQISIEQKTMSKPAFRYSHYDLGEQRAGTVIEITLSAIANVRLMNGSNFERFTETLKHQFLGGVAKKSPIWLVIPEAGHWHLVVDMEGHKSLAESSVKMVDRVTVPRMQKA